VKRLATLMFVLLAAAPAAARETNAGQPLPPAVDHALSTALAVPGARVDVRSYQPAGAVTCPVTQASVERAVEGSGRYPVKVSGQGCTGWAWVELKVFAHVLVTTRAVRAGENLEGAAVAQDREVRPGRQPAANVTGAKASRPLTRGQLIEKDHLDQAGLAPGSPVKVNVRAGSLSIVQNGRIVSCGRGRTCAVMPSGRHVEGQIVDGQLVVEAP
jgi:flagella basal body P-ring formation protein FlgA